MIKLLHLKNAKVVAVEGEQDDGVSEPRGDAHRPRGELVVEQEPPRAAAVRPVQKPLIQSAQLSGLRPLRLPAQKILLDLTRR